jgi:HEAT repeat protein
VKALSAAFSDNDDATRRQWLGEALLAAADRAELTADLRAESLGLLMAKGTPAMQLAGAGALLRYDMDRAALARVIVAAKSTVRSERAQATTFLGTCVERHGIGSLGDGFDSLPLDVKCALVRHESGAERLLSQLGRAREKPLQLEVLKRIGQCGDETVIPPLCERLEGAAEGDQRAAVVDALVALPATPAVSQAFRAYKIRVNGKARESLAEVFARRGLATFGPDVLGWIQQGLVPADKGWRALAELAGPPLLAPLTRELAKNPEHRKLIGKALLAAAKRCEDVQTGAPLTKRLAVAPDAEEREILVQALGELGDRQSLASALGDASLDVRLAAIRALGEHGEATDVPLLLKAAEVPDPRQNALALRAALQVLCSRLDPVFAPPEAGDWLRVASQAARRDEERRQVAQTAARFPQAALLPLLGDTPDAFLDVAEAVWPDAPDAVRSRLSRLVAETKDQKIKARAQTVLGRIAAFQPFLGKLAERPWQPAFNGRNLDGWRPVGGKPDSWTVADGLLVANAGGGGWLARAEEMGDYLFELEFRLSPGGNSGFFLRPPLAGNPAWEGIEVQMLDDAASQYAGKLRADQYCASIYGMGPAQPGISRPPGQWQKLRVLCAGRHVAVWLNGKPVSYAALDEHMGKADKIHGLNRASGFPGLQNEHGPTQFRNLRFRDLR